MVPPSRQAIARSRRNQLPECGHAACASRPRCSSRALTKPSGTCVAATTMPPRARCAFTAPVSASWRRAVERGGRLIEQPHRTLREQQPRKTQPPLLAGGQVARRNVAQSGQAESLERRLARAAVAKEAAPEGSVLRNREARLDRIGMPDIVALLAQCLVRGAALHEDATRSGMQQTRNRAQKRRLAGSIGPHHEQCLPRCHAE